MKITYLKFKVYFTDVDVFQVGLYRVVLFGLQYKDAKNINQSNSFKTSSFITLYLIKRSMQMQSFDKHSVSKSSLILR